jgi:hypothetical protein
MFVPDQNVQFYGFIKSESNEKELCFDVLGKHSGKFPLGVYYCSRISNNQVFRLLTIKKYNPSY